MVSMAKRRRGGYQRVGAVGAHALAACELAQRPKTVLAERLRFCAFNEAIRGCAYMQEAVCRFRPSRQSRWSEEDTSDEICQQGSSRVVSSPEG
jgi:hypothetical protein